MTNLVTPGSVIDAANVANDAGLPRIARKTVTFTGAAGAGAVGQVTVFTVTGRVLVKSLSAYCTADLAGATATLSLGTAANVTGFIGVTTATDVDSGEFWLTTTPTAGLLALPAALKDIAVSANITIDVLTANITAGTLIIVAEYVPISTDGAIA